MQKMSRTYKTDPYGVKEARGTTWNPREFARERSVFTAHRRDLPKRIRARERREMERIARDIEAWDDYTATVREFATETNRDCWQF